MAVEIQPKTGNVIVVKEVVVGAVSTHGTMAISASLPPTVMLGGRELVEVVTIPGTGAFTPATYAGKIEDALGRTILTIASRSATLTETLKGSTTLTYNPILWSDWTVTLTAIGAGDKVTTYLVFK